MHTSLPTAGVPPIPMSAVGGFPTGAMVGPWMIEGELGRGGMSTVYAVVHAEIGKRAALKVVHASLVSRVISTERILLEAQVVNRAAHPNIVDIFESGTLDDGRPYLVMERLDGNTLGQRMREDRMTPNEVIAILLQLCSALEAAHEAGVIHRDLKLDNVCLIDGPDGPVSRAKILDWGIAKDVTATPRDTFADRLIGTPQYVSPEQAKGGEVGPPSDIYSLGVMAYEMFLEGPPFVSDSAAELLVMHLRDQPPPPHEVWPDIPPTLEALLLAMLAKDPALRPTAPEVARELTAIRDQLKQRTLAGIPRESLLRMDAPAMVSPALATTCHASELETPSTRFSSRMLAWTRGPLTWPRAALAAVTFLALGTGAVTVDSMLDPPDAGGRSVEAATLPATRVDTAPTAAAPTKTVIPPQAAAAILTSTTVVDASTRAERAADAKATTRVHRSRPRAARRDADSPPMRPGVPAARTRPGRPRTGLAPIDPDGTLEPYR